MVDVNDVVVCVCWRLRAGRTSPTFLTTGPDFQISAFGYENMFYEKN
jgi:hypothetical protein